MHKYWLPKEKVKYLIVAVGIILLLSINICDRGHVITHQHIPRFHIKIWYNDLENPLTLENILKISKVGGDLFLNLLTSSI